MVTDSPTRTSHVSESRLWFGLLAGASAWAVHGFLSVVLTTRACLDGSGNLGPISPAGVRILLSALTLVLLAVCVAGGFTAYRSWQVLTRQNDLLHAEGRKREEYMALLGICVTAAFTVGLLWAGLPLVLLDLCVKSR